MRALVDPASPRLLHHQSPSISRPRPRTLLLARLSVDSSKTPPSDADHEKQLNRALAVGEGICIVSATSAFIASHYPSHPLLLLRRSSDNLVGTASSAPPPLSPVASSISDSLPAWQTFFLLLALIINAVSRARRWLKSENRRETNYVVDARFGLEDRIKRLEEEVTSTVTIVRVLSKQLEKLGVRFRLTRRTLRDPIQETALLAQKASESVDILAARGDKVEKELEAIQYALLGMQDNQTKQLELISALGKLMKHRTKSRILGPDLTKLDDHKANEMGRIKISNSVTPNPQLIPVRVDYWLHNDTSESKADATK